MHQKTTKKVDIIIVNWNGLHHLEICLPSVKAQTLKPGRVIVVDNGSTDGSQEWIKEYHPWIDLISLEENKGFTGANIAGFEASSGDYIVLLNNDTKPVPDWLEMLVAAADYHPEAGIIASVMLRWNSPIIDTAGDSCTWAGTGFKATTGLNLDEAKDGYVFGACAGAALYKRKMLEEIGFLDPDYFLNQEDIDLSFRAQLAGWKVWLAAKALVYHRVAASKKGKVTPLVIFHGAKNNEATFWKNMPAGLIVRALPHRLVQSFSAFLKIGIKQRMWRPFLKGKWHAVLHFPGTLKKRRKVQKLKKVSDKYIRSMLTPVCSFEYLFARKRIRNEYSAGMKNVGLTEKLSWQTKD